VGHAGLLFRGELLHPGAPGPNTKNTVRSQIGVPLDGASPVLMGSRRHVAIFAILARTLVSAQPLPPHGGDLRCMQALQHADELHQREIDAIRGLHERELTAQNSRHSLEVNALRTSYEKELTIRAERLPVASSVHNVLHGLPVAWFMLYGQRRRRTAAPALGACATALATSGLNRDFNQRGRRSTTICRARGR
jgi:hypothetical protein